MTERERTGSLYSEMTNKGRCSMRYVRGCKPVCCFRWVAEITISRKRHRFRSTSYDNCRRWLDDMIAKAGPIRPGKRIRAIREDSCAKSGAKPLQQYRISCKSPAADGFRFSPHCRAAGKREGKVAGGLAYPPAGFDSPPPTNGPETAGETPPG